MPAKSFRAELQEAWDEIKEARRDQKITIAEWLRILADTLDAAARLCHSSVGTDEDFNILVADVEWFAHEYLVKPDLPFVSEFTERYVVDPAIVPMVRPILTAARGATK